MASEMIDINYLKELLEIFDASSVNDLRIEQREAEVFDVELCANAFVADDGFREAFAD